MKFRRRNFVGLPERNPCIDNDGVVSKISQVISMCIVLLFEFKKLFLFSLLKKERDYDQSCYFLVRLTIVLFKECGEKFSYLQQSVSNMF
jgi:hypothetical protein